MAIDKELIKALSLMKQGKEEGFNTLYMHTHNYVYGRAKLIMKNEEDALDLTQEVFVQAYKGIDKLENANNLYAWLGAITYNQGMKMFNKKTDILVEEDGDYIFEEIVSTDKDSSPEATAEEKAVAEVVMDMIEELPELQKTALVAFYYDNMKIEDIAVMCECSANTIKSRLNYAKKFLKEKVESHEKANGYKLHSVTPLVFAWAIKAFLSRGGYTMSGAAVKAVYGGACASAGVGTVAGVATATTAQVATQVATTTVKGAGFIGKIASLSTATKVVAGIVAAAVVTGSVVAGIYINSDQDRLNGDKEVVVSEEEDSAQLPGYDSVDEYLGKYIYRNGDRAWDTDGGCQMTITDAYVNQENVWDSVMRGKIELAYKKEISNGQYKTCIDSINFEIHGFHYVPEIRFTEISSEGIEWHVEFDLPVCGFIHLVISVEENGALHSIFDDYFAGFDGNPFTSPLFLTKAAASDSFQGELKIQEGTYIHTNGNNVYSDGGYIVKISDIIEKNGAQHFTTEIIFISEDGVDTDTALVDHYMGPGFRGNMLCFCSDTIQGNWINGYLSVLDDDRILLGYDIASESFLFPDELIEPLILIRE